MKQKDLLRLLIFAAAGVLVWIIFSVIHSRLSSTISEEVSKQISPITPSFDTRIVSVLKSRLQIAPVLQLGNTDVSTQSAIPTPVVIPTTAPTTTPQSAILQGGGL